MQPEFRSLDDDAGFVVVDPIEDRRLTIATAEPVEPTPTGTEAFTFPVTAAAVVETTELETPYLVGMVVHTADGGVVGAVEHGTVETFPPDSYVLDFGVPIKLYARVEAGLTVSTEGDATVVSFEEPTEVTFGARSYHERPAETITTTADPRDLMTAVGSLASSLKTTNPERSYPTLRGHPPKIELGDRLAIPNGMDAPDVGVTLELPPRTEYVFPAAPLAFYLAADLEPASEARLVTDDGLACDLGTGEAFETAVARLLKRTFLMDCVVRTEGLYPLGLVQRSVVEERVDVDAARLYRLPLTERLRAYQDVPYEVVEAALPTWCLVADLRPDAESVEALPYVLDDLGIVRVYDPEPPEPRPEFQERVNSFVRRDGIGRGPRECTVGDSGSGPRLLRSTSESESGSAVEVRYTQPEPAAALEQLFVGRGRPFGASKFLRAGFENKFQRPETPADITITVVCNESEMRPEYGDETIYGDREELPFDVTYHQELSRDDLLDVLETRTDFLHYIGHIEDGSFVCEEDHLDAREVERSGPRTFLLNGCKSYEAGCHLVEAGSVGGVVTLNDVGNQSAITVGQLLARLLTGGFSLGSALEVVKGQSVVSHQYLVVGDCRTDVVQDEGMYPTVWNVECEDVDSCAVECNGPDSCIVEQVVYPSSSEGVGGVVIPHLPEASEYQVAFGPSPVPVPAEFDALREVQAGQNQPVVLDGELMWSLGDG